MCYFTGYHNNIPSYQCKTHDGAKLNDCVTKDILLDTKPKQDS
jgi:hypothetical protein